MTSLAKRLKWNKVLLECDSLVLCKDVPSSEPSQCWAISSMVEHIQHCWEEFREWKVAWVPRKCNELAHLLAKWVARFGLVGWFCSYFCYPQAYTGL